MKIIKQSIQHQPFLSNTPVLVSAFLSSLIESEEALIELLNPTLKRFDSTTFKSLLKEKILICGDYDADGILSTTLLFRYCQKLQKEVGYYIPNRLTQGYGTSLETIVSAHSKGYDTIILVDNGVINTSVHTYCKENHLTLIVIDHHQIPEPVQCDYLVHPDVLEPYFEGLCSAGLVLSLMGFEADAFDIVLAGIATIGDMMELKRQNRAIVKEAIRLLNQQRFPVIESLLRKPVPQWDEEIIAFQIVPVFNALGRLADLGNVNNIVKYLLSNDSIVISQFSHQLKKVNQQRKNLSANQTKMALDLLRPTDLFQIVYHPDFHEGIVGIIAGQLSNTNQKPTLVLSGKDILKGSVRAQGFNVYEFLSPFQDEYFMTFGGHESACALSIKESDLEKFSQAVQAEMRKVSIQPRTIEVIELQQEDILLEAFLTFKQFAPFGQGFKPLPLYLEVMVIGVRLLGQAGYLLTILPVGDLKEILYFNKDLIIEDNNIKIGVIGNLQVNQMNQLSLIGQHIFMI